MNGKELLKRSIMHVNIREDSSGRMFPVKIDKIDRIELCYIVDKCIPDEPEKVKIPYYVAEWVEGRRKYYNDFEIITMMRKTDWGKHGILNNWAKPDSNMLLLIQALVNGYEVEETLYYAKIKGTNDINFRNSKNCYLIYQINTKYLFVSPLVEHSEYKSKFTKEEWEDLGVTDENADFEEVEDE